MVLVVSPEPVNGPTPDNLYIRVSVKLYPPFIPIKGFNCWVA